MSIIRKRSLDKNRSALLKSAQQHTQDSNHSTKSFSQLIQTLKWYIKQLQTTPLDQIHKSVSDLLNGIIQSKKTVIISQRLQGYCQCFQLMSKYLMHVKLKGGDPLDQQCVVALSVFRGIVDEINKFTQDEKNDQIIKQSNIVVVSINVLEPMVASIQSQSQKIEKKSTMFRKNSLKKIQQLPTIRPTSRGKLSSLSKTANKLTKAEILLPQIKLQQKASENCTISLEETVLKLFAILKNLSANKHVRRQLLKEEYLRLFNRYLSIWNEKNMSQYGNSLMVQITSAYRHLAADDKAYKFFLASNCLEVWSKAIEMFPTSNDIIFNLLRIFSKISSYSQCCEKLNEKKLCLKTLGTFFKVYRSNIHIIIRVAFIFANMTSYLSDIRTQLYFDFATWPDIYGCFVHYADSQLKGKSQIEKMGVSMAAWDYQAMKKESDIEALIKIIRLIANIFTVSNIGQDIYMNDSKSYRDLVFKLSSLLQRFNITRHADLITCVLSCLTNVLYYDKQVLLANTQYKHAKNQLIAVLVNFVVQIDNQQICCESLRVLSNLTRMKQYIKPIIQAKIHQALMILLDSTSKEIVYYSLGTLLNLLVDEQFRKQYNETLVSSILQILSACESQDFDLVGVALKALSTIMSGNIDPKLLTEIQNALVNLGNNCDRIIIDQSQKVELVSVQQSRALINVLLNNMPEQKYICPFKNCGRKFADEAKLKEHTNRRHKAS